MVQLRRPIAAAFLPGSGILCVANQRSGSVCLVDLAGKRVLDEFPAGKRLSGLAVLPDGKHVLVVDDERHELIALDVTAKTVRARLSVAPYPASVVVLPQGRRALVASLWSRRVELVDLTSLLTSQDTVSLRVLHTTRLPFAPRGQALLPGGSQVVVADAFAGHLAILDADTGKIVALQRLTGHNLRGLAVSADGRDLLLAHQLLDQKAPTTRENVERGLLMQNVVTAIPLARLRDPKADLNSAGRVVRLEGDAGDPAGIAVLEGGRLAVALAGVNEVALLGPEGQQPRRISVGRRPTLLVTAPGQPLVCVNSFDDSLLLLDSLRGAAIHTIELGRQPRLRDRDRGEMLFHDARLSRGATMSCHSCHTDGHTNGLLADTLGDGTYGTPKRTLTLLNTRMTDPWGWNGGMQYLHEQVQKSLVETMHAPVVKYEQVGDLTAFLHTLPPPPPPEPPTTRPAGHAGVQADRDRIERGRVLFEQHRCVRCHIPPLTYSSHGTHDVGSPTSAARPFNPPSLRGVGQGYGFLHDNRAATLEEVFTRFHHKVDDDLDAEQLADLLRFLRSL